MSVTPSTLATIQQAGQSIDVARQSLVAAVNEHAQQVMAAVSEQPFSVDNDKLFATWKTLSRMAQEVNAIEEQFKALYQSAAALVQPETAVLMSLSHSPRHKVSARSLDADNAIAQDVQIKQRALKKESRRAAPPASRKPGAKTLSANDTQVLSYLQTVLDRRSWTRLTQAGMAAGAGIPLGSIGLALRRLISMGRVLEGAKGRYKLA